MGNLTATFTYTQYTGVNTVKVAIYKDSDPNTEIQAQYMQGPFTNGIFAFTGLDRVAYKVKRFEVANDNHSNILADYGVFFVFIPNNQKIEYKSPVAWKAGIDNMPDGTPYPAGVKFFSNADWAGWEADMLHYFGGIYMRGRDYTYDAVTGTPTKLQEGDVFEQDAYYEIRFAPRVGNIGGESTGGGSADFSGKLYITANATLTPTDAGKKILIKGTAGYIEVLMPNANDTPELKRYYVEMPPSNVIRCAKFKSQNGVKIDFGKGNLTEICLYPSESFEFYKETDNTDEANPVSYWRIQNAQGNFLTVGETVADEADASHVINKVEKNGAALDANVYSRLLAWVKLLPSNQRTTFAAHTSGNNKYLYSDVDPITNKFFVPDTRDLFERQSSALRPAGSFQADAMIDHEHPQTIGELPDNIPNNGRTVLPVPTGQYNALGTHRLDLTGKPYILKSPGGWAQQDASSETRPKNVAINKYVRI